MKIICTSHALLNPDFVTTLAQCYLSFSLLEDDNNSLKLTFSADNFFNLLNYTLRSDITSTTLKNRYIFSRKKALLKSLFFSKENKSSLIEIANNSLGKVNTNYNHYHLFEVFDCPEDFEDEIYLSSIQRELDYFTVEDFLPVLNLIKDRLDNIIFKFDCFDYSNAKFIFNENEIIISKFLKIKDQELYQLKKDVFEYVNKHLPIFLEDCKTQEKCFNNYINLYNNIKDIIETKDNNKLYRLIVDINKYLF